MVKNENVKIEVEGKKIDAIHYPGEGTCVVMAHGFGAVKDGLIPFAEVFSKDFGVLLFDYRHFGESEGEPRQLIDIGKQLQDWRKAIEFAKMLGYENIALWGTSFSGGHVLKLSSEIDVSAVVAQVPFVDGLATVTAIHSITDIITLTMLGLADKLASISGKTYRLPIVAEPERLAFMNTPESIRYLEIIPEGAKWENSAPARIALSVSFYRPIKHVKEIRCPVLYVVGERDTITPANKTLEVAKQTPNAEVVKFDGGHFDGYLELFEFCVEKEHDFLVRHLLK